MRFLTTVIAICLFSSTALALSDGDTFTANSEEGIEVLYQVISETEKTVRVGKDATMSKAYETAVARDVTGQLTIPVTVNGYRVVELSIGAFYWRGGITEIVLPEGLERIENAFYQNGALRRMNIPSTVTFFEASFTGCNSLECIVVPDCVTEVWRAALAGAGFKSVTLPAGITSIGYEAFIYSNFLSGVFVNAVTPPVLDETAFQTTPYYNYYENTTIFVPEGSVSAYRAADGWSNFKEIRAPYTEGDVFTWTDKTGLEYEFIVTSAEEKTVQLGNGTRAAISAGYQGNINVPTYAKGYRVASIADNAFEGCSGISAVTASFDYPMDFSVSAFPASVYSNGCLYVPEDLRSRYAAKTGWNSFARVNPGDYALWDSFLAQTAEGVSMAFTVSDVNRKYVYCGDYRGNYFKDYQAIDSKTEGPVTIPDYVNGYKVTGIGYNAFSGCTKMTSVHMPESVTKIDKEGFSYCTSMASINLPAQLETIGKWAFWGCRSLSGQLSIPSSVTAIGEEAFAGCSSLSSIDVESGNPVYDSRDNSHSLIRTATNELVLGGSDAVIPSTVTAIGPSAFTGNKNITEINIPANVTSIGTSAYSGCSNAKRVVLNGTPAIAASAFKNLNDSCRVYVFSDVMPTLTEDAFSPKKTLCVPRSQRDGYLADAAWSQFERIRGMFPQGTEQFTVNTAEGDMLTIQITDPMMMTAQVGDGAHQALDNTSATSVTIPADAEDYDCQTIAANAFSNFPALKRVVVSNGINAIEGGAFSGTTLPDSIYCQAEAAYAIADNAFSDDIYNSSRLAVEPSLREAFAAQPGWRRFAHIGDPAIDLTGVTSLTAQTIEGVTLTFTVIDAEARTLRVGAPNDGAAAYWRTEGKITIPAEVMGCQVVEIGNKAFKSCSYLLAVTIPASVNSIGENAFGRNTVLIDILKETPVDIPANAFTNYAGAKLHVPQGCKAAYQAAQYWKDFGFITDAEFISDDMETFVCSNADGVPITYKLTDRLRLKVVVGDGEHAAVANGQSGVVCIPELANEMYSVEGISCNAFKDCSMLTGVVIPASIAAIDSAAFARCDALASVRCISPGVLDIGEHAFDEAIYSNATLQVYSFLTDTVATAPGWRNFKTVTDFMESGIVFTTKTVEGVDMTCTTLDADSKTVMIGTVNGDNACNKNVKGKVSIPSEIGRCRVTAIGNNAFLYCMRLTETDIPESIESIGEAAFEDCALQSLTIPAAVACIGKWAFSFNSSLKLVDVRRAEPAVLGFGAFYGVNATLHVPSGCAKAYRNANYWKDFEKIIEMGDANGDGDVDIADAVNIVNYVVGKSTPGFNDKAADVNSDGVVDIADAVRIVNLVVGKIDALAPKMELITHDPQ